MTDNELKEHCLQEAGIDLGRYSYNELNVIKDALRRYHNVKLKLLSLSDVSVSLISDEEIKDAAEKWIFNENGMKWSNNDDTAGDNYGSFIAGVKWALIRLSNDR